MAGYFARFFLREGAPTFARKVRWRILGHLFASCSKTHFLCRLFTQARGLLRRGVVLGPIELAAARERARTLLVRASLSSS